MIMHTAISTKHPFYTVL